LSWVYINIYLSNRINEFILIELLMSIWIVQALHVDGHAALAQWRTASGKPRWTRGRIGQVRAYWSRAGRHHCRYRRFSLDACYPLWISRAVISCGGSGSRFLQIAQVVVACSYRWGTLLLLNVADHSGRSRSWWSLRRRRWSRFHWHCRMSTAKQKTNIKWDNLLLLFKTMFCLL